MLIKNLYDQDMQAQSSNLLGANSTHQLSLVKDTALQSQTALTMVARNMSGPIERTRGHHNTAMQPGQIEHERAVTSPRRVTARTEPPSAPERRAAQPERQPARRCLPPEPGLPPAQRSAAAGCSRTRPHLRTTTHGLPSASTGLSLRPITGHTSGSAPPHDRTGSAHELLWSR